MKVRREKGEIGGRCPGFPGPCRKKAVARAGARYYCVHCAIVLVDFAQSSPVVHLTPIAVAP